MDCDRPLTEIYEETMEMVKVNFVCGSGTRLMLIVNSVSSPGGATREGILGVSTAMKDSRFDKPQLYLEAERG